MELRDYQSAQLERARDRLRAGVNRLLLQLPTGGGKTVMAATMLSGTAKRNLRAWFIVHRKELLEQTSLTFNAVGIRHGFIATGFPINSDAPVQLCGIQTLVNRLLQPGIVPADVIVWDEAHHSIAASWARVMNCYPCAKHIGLSATPERLDGRGLKEHFDEIIPGPTVAELIARGYLSPFRYFAPGTPDLSGVKTTGGDFNRGELGVAMDKAALIGDVVEHYLRLAPGQQGIVFAASREHSRHLAEAFSAAGVRSAHVDGSMKDGERRSIVDGFRAGGVRVMTNVDLFGEGFDVPGLVYCGLARPTKSLALHLQQVGRALRVMEGKREAIICDHAGNAFSHGLPDDPRTWTLDGRKAGRARPGPTDAFAIRTCLECYQVSPSSTRECPGCGHAFPIVNRAPEGKEGELHELTRAAVKKQERKLSASQRKAEERECETIADFTALGIKRGYDNPSGWAKHQVAIRSSYASKYRRRAA